MTLTSWFKLREYSNNFRALDFSDDSNGTNSIILSNLGNRNDANWSTSIDTTAHPLTVNSLWKLNEWQHLAVTIEGDGLTNFYSDGNYISSQPGKYLRT